MITPDVPGKLGVTSDPRVAHPRVLGWSKCAWVVKVTLGGLCVLRWLKCPRVVKVPLGGQSVLGWYKCPWVVKVPLRG